MKAIYFLAAVPLLGAATFNASAPRSEAACQARLESRVAGNMLTLVGHCLNTGLQPLALHYELLTEKKGPAGTSRNAQAGDVALAPQQTAVLSQTTISVSPADFYRVRLLILDRQGRVMAVDSLVHQPASHP